MPFLARQAAVRERDRLRTLFDITNSLVSKLEPDEPFSAIGTQLSKLIRHDYSMLTVSNSESGLLDLYALHSTGLPFIDALKGPLRFYGHAGGRGTRNREAGSGVRHRYRALSVANLRKVSGAGIQVCLLGSIGRPESNHWYAGALSNDGRYVVR